MQRARRALATLAALPLTAGLLTGLSGPASAAQDPFVINKGHVDVVALRMDAGRLRMEVKDQSTGSTVRRQPADVVVQALPAAEIVIPGDTDFDFSFLGPPGATTWLLPELQDENVVWAGYEIAGLLPGELQNDEVTLRLLSVKGPGSLSMFVNGPSGEPHVIATTLPGWPKTVPTPVVAALDQRTTIPLEANHAHMNWAFSQTGSYDLVFQADGLRTDGVPVSTGMVTYRFVIGAMPTPVSLVLAGGQQSYVAGNPVSLSATVAPDLPGATYSWLRTCPGGAAVVDAGQQGPTYSFAAAVELSGCSVRAEVFDRYGVKRAASAPAVLNVQPAPVDAAPTTPATAATAATVPDPMPAPSAPTAVAPAPTVPDPVPTTPAPTTPAGVPTTLAPAPVTPSVSAPQQPVRPTVLARAKVSGPGTVGTRATCAARFRNATKVAYAWTRDNRALAAKSSSRLLGKADLGHRVACRATATGLGGAVTSASAPLLVKAAALRALSRPAMSGKAVVCQTLHAAHGRWAPESTSHRYQWLRDGRAIANATRASYRLVKADKGHLVSVRVTATRKGSSPGIAVSAARRVK